mmetsp:Transcript_77210/g.218514  ORF Transcript_77210/g.218514 Transcript_77210/m.218514 type:complete len:201 (+) Transcript_77210:244-846(+)
MPTFRVAGCFRPPCVVGLSCRCQGCSTGRRRSDSRPPCTNSMRWSPSSHRRRRSRSPRSTLGSSSWSACGTARARPLPRCSDGGRPAASWPWTSTRCRSGRGCRTHPSRHCPRRSCACCWGAWRSCSPRTVRRSWMCRCPGCPAGGPYSLVTRTASSPTCSGSWTSMGRPRRRTCTWSTVTSVIAASTPWRSGPSSLHSC